MKSFKFLTLNSANISKLDSGNIPQVMYGVPSGPFANPPRTISTVLVFIIGLVMLIIKRKSSWKIKAIIIIATLIGIVIALNINWTRIFYGDTIL